MQKDFPFTLVIMPYLLILVLTTMWLYLMIPAEGIIPIHFTLSGQPDWYVGRNLFLSLFVTFEILVSFSIFYSAKYWDMRINQLLAESQSGQIKFGENVKEYHDTKNKLFIFNLFFYFLLILSLFNYSLFYDQIKYHISAVLFASIIITIIIIDLVMTVSLIKLRKSSLNEAIRATIDTKYPEMLDEYWMGGVIYYNPSDKRFFIAKKSGLGITINHGRKGLAVLFYIILVSLIIWMVIR